MFAIKNLHFDLKGPAFDSDRVHLGGIDARADQNDQKWISIIHPQILDANLGHHETPLKFNIQNFPNS